MANELKIALMQSDLIWEDPEKNRIEFSKKLDTIPSDVDLIVLPEMFTTGFTMHPEKLEAYEGDKTLEWMRQKASEKQAAITGSIPFQENGSYTNRLFFVEPDAKTSLYDKRHTFTLAGEDLVYKAGKERLIVHYKGFKICPLVCYDLRFPVWARNTEEYDILIYVANWPKPRISAWDVLLKARAIENMVYCIGVNRTGTDEVGNEYTGHSAIYDSLGGQVRFSNQETVIYATLSKDHIVETRNKLRFLEDRDQFNLIS